VTSRVSLSQSSSRIDEVWSWYSTSTQALAAYKQTIKASIVDKHVVCSDFVGFHLNDLDQHFGRQQEELAQMVALAILIAAEGELRRDYWTRVYERKKDELSRHFREIHKRRGKRVSLERISLQDGGAIGRATISVSTMIRLALSSEEHNSRCG
jgi:hypothetical protein